MSKAPVGSYLPNKNITEKSEALREIRINDASRYTEICRVLAENDLVEEFETVPLEYAYDIVDDSPSAEDTVFLSEMKTKLNVALLKLKPREEKVLRTRFGIGLKKEYNLEETGQKLSVTRERIRQMEAKAIRKLKLFMRKAA
jgi:RNA polymerase sigma factor (sigma-70 family)